mgnify:CR=1 FL=1
MESRPTELWLQPCEFPRRQLSAVGRKLLRRALASRNLRLLEHQYSLPGVELIELLSSTYGIAVSISHCPGLVAVALGSVAIGVDCESGNQKRDWAQLAEFAFTPAEAGTLARLSVEDQAASFLRHWVCKEAFVKLKMGSVFGDLNRLLLADDGTFVIDTYSDELVHLWCGVYLGFQLALCYQTEASSPPVVFDNCGTPLPLNLIQIHQSRRNIA